LSLSFTDFNQIGANVAMFPLDNCRVSLPSQITP